MVLWFVHAGVGSLEYVDRRIVHNYVCLVGKLQGIQVACDHGSQLIQDQCLKTQLIL